MQYITENTIAITADSESEKFTGVLIGPEIFINGQQYAMAGYINDLPQWGFQNDGAFPHSRCAYCGSMSDMRGNCDACGAPK